MKKLLLLLLCLALAASLSGCAASRPSDAPEQAEAVTLDWYVNFSWYSTAFGGNIVSEVIKEKTGVDVRFISPEGNESVTLDAKIAGDSLPDLVTLGWWEPQLNEMIAKEMVWPLNQLADEACPAFWAAADAARVRWYTQPDGNLYCYPNSSYSPADYETRDDIASNQTFLVRKDLYEALGSPDMTTPEGFADAVRRAAQQFPTVDGLPLIPIGAHEFTERGCDSFDKFLLSFLAVPYEKDGAFYDRYADAEYKRWLSMFRSLGESGLLAGDIFIDKRAQMEEKIAQGRYFCMLYQRTDIAEQQLMRYASDPGSVYIAVDGPRNAAGDAHCLPGSGVNGWTVTLISKNCKQPQKAIELMAYLMSEEGQKLIALGVEGENYTMSDGRAILTASTRSLKMNDYAAYVSTIGANDTYWMLQDNLMQSQWMPLDEPVLQQMKEWCYPYTCYTGQYDISFPQGSAEAEAAKKLELIHGEMLPLLLLAPTEAEFERLWTEYQTRRQQAGLADYLALCTEQMQDNKERLGLNP